MEKVQDLLIASGAKDIKHVKFGSLYDHLLRVSTILKSWELDDNIQMAGMLHSVYNTEYFKGNLLSIDKEKVLQDIVGGEVNDIINSIINFFNCIFFNSHNMNNICIFISEMTIINNVFIFIM